MRVITIKVDDNKNFTLDAGDLNVHQLLQLLEAAKHEAYKRAILMDEENDANADVQ